MPHDIFLSYSRKDAEIMQRVKNSFLSAGLSVWTDEGIDPTSPSWKIEIESAIREAKCLVCILSPDAVSSRWVREELSYAEGQNKRIILLLAKGNASTSIPFGFMDHQRSDIRDESRYDSEIKKLIKTIKEQSTITPPTAADLLPAPFEWCDIPGGEGYYGSSTEGLVTEFVKDFWIAKYPVTNLQFQFFMDEADGYNNPHLWEKLPEISQLWFKHMRRQSAPNFSGDWCPRENVNWHEAMAFCYWLSGRLGLSITLPTRAQRVYVVRGTRGLEYPWGKEFDSTRCNTRENMIERTTSVTKYPGGASGYGVMDLSGNVWEWSLTDCSDEANKIAGYYMYGGGWRGRRRHTIADFPRWQRSDYRAPDVGFRICAVF